MLVDTHTHFYDEWLLPDAEAAIQRALEAGVGKMIQADVDSAERPRMWEIGASGIPECYSRCWACIPGL